ncbi:SwmB domain-containing protein, partial [Azospirillum argentinense]
MLHSTVSRPAPAILGREGVPEASRREVAFIDMALDDWQALKAEIPAGIEVFLIDSRADGMAAMARTLDARRDIHAIHVLSHGFEGGLQLGSGRFDTRALAQRVEELASIASSLAPDGDILLYGCNVASGRGADFLTALADATGANVVASRTPTGAADRGGDWDLDWVHGAVRTTPLRIDSYRGVMTPASPPVLVSTVAYSGESTIELIFDQPLDSNSLPLLSRFEEGNNFTAGYAEVSGAPFAVTSASISGATLTLTIAKTFTPGDTVASIYTDPAGDDANGVLQSAAGGIDVATFLLLHTVPGPRPAPQLVSASAQVGSGQIVVTFDQNLDSSNPPPASAFRYGGSVFGYVSINGMDYSIANITVVGATVIIEPTGYTFVDGDVVDIDYVDGAGDTVAAIQGVTGTDASSFTNNFTVQHNPPTVAATGGTPTFTQGGTSGVDLFSGVAADTNDIGQSFTELTLTVTNVTDNEALLGIGTSAILLSITTNNSPVAGLPGATATVSFNGTTATLTVTGLSLSNADMTSLIDGLSYINSSSTVTTGNRVITVTSVTDDGYALPASVTGVSATVSVTAAQVPTFAAPTLTATGSTGTFTTSPLDLFSAVTASTNDTGQVFTGLTLTITGVLDGSDEKLGFNLPGGGGFSVLALSNGGVAAGTAVSLTGTASLSGGTITATIGGLQLSAADMQWFIDNIVYNNIASTPSDGQRVVTITGVTDDGANNSTASLTGIAATINIGLQAPTLTATGGTPTFTQGGVSGVDLFSTVTANTNDSGQVFTGLTLTVTNVTDTEALGGIGTNVIALSSLAPFIVPGITGSGPGVIASVTKTGTTVTVTLANLNHTDAQLGSLIDGLTYINSSSTVTTGNRVITVASVADNGGSNNTASLTGVSATVTVTATAAAPVLQSAAVTGDSLVLTYDVALDSVNPPAAGAFTVTVGGTPVTVSGVTVDGANNTVTLTLGQVVAYGDTVAVSYTDPTAGDDANAIQAGTGGSDAASFTGQSVTNNSPDPSTTPPSITAIDAYVGENVIIVTFDQTLDAQSPLLLSSFGAVDSYVPLDFGTDAIIVGNTNTGDVKVDLRSAVISGNKLILTTVSPLAQGDYVRFTYSDPAGNDTVNVLQNLSGLDLPDTRFATMVTTTRTVNTPSLTATGNATTFTSSSSPADLYSSVTANANDLGQVFTGLTFTVTGVLDGASEYLIFMIPGAMSAIMNLADGASLMGGPFGVTGGATLNGSTLTVTISGLRLSADEMQSLLDGFYYNNVASTPSDGQRIITLASVTDSGVSNNIGTPTGISAVINIGAPPTPVLQSAAVNGTSLVLTYDTALDAVNIPPAGSFTVMAGGSPVTVSGVAVDTATKTVTLTLAQPVAYGAAVTVSYADPTAGDDANAIQSFGGGLDAAGFTGQSATNTTPDPNGVPPTLALTTKDSGFLSGNGSGGTDLFDGVTASTVDNGQTFTGAVLKVYNVVGTGSVEFLSIGGTDIALSNATTGSFTGGNYAVTLANGVATVTLSGMALSNSDMGTLIDGIAYKHTGTSSVTLGYTETRSVVLHSITDSGAGNATTVVDQVATVSIGNTQAWTPFLTVTPTNPTVTFTPGTSQQVSFTVTSTVTAILVGSTLEFGVTAPSGWTVANVTMTPTITGVINAADTFTLTFDVTSSGTDTTGSFPISVYSMSTGINQTNSAVSSSVMVTVAIPPVLQSASVDGTTLVLTYDSALDAAHPPAAGAFEVKVGGTTVTVSGVAVDSVNKTVTLTLAQAVTDTDTVTVAYTDPTAGNDANAIQSTIGDDAASFTARPVTNTTPDTTPPTLTSAVLSGTRLTLTYSEALDGAQTPVAGAFTVTVGGVVRTVTAVATAGRMVTLTLDTGASSLYEGATVSYTPPGSGAKTVDAAGNAAGALNGQPVRVGGDPSFTLEATNPFGIGSFVGQSAPVFADIDGDGDLDAVVGDWYANIVVYRNVGTAEAPSFTLVGTNPFGLNTVGGGMPAFAKPVLADIDGDGDLDLLAGNAGGDTVVYRNVGTAAAPSFTLVGTNPFGLSNAGGFASPSLADIDGDGDLDVLIGNANGDTLFYRNVGTATAPTFALESTNPFGLGNAGSNATPIFVDIDGDGDLDALIGNDSGNTVFYRNIGTAAAPTFTLEGTNPFNLGDVGSNAKPTFADIDGDGDLDALIGRDDGKTVLYRNTTPPPATPTAPTLTAGSNSGSTTDTLTNVTAPAIVGTAVASSTVVLYDGATAIGTVTADASSGLWTLSTASLSDGTHSLTVTSSNVNGTSTASTALTLTIDTKTPTLTSATLNGTQLTLTYSELLDGAQTPAGAFTVMVGGVARTVTAVATSGKTVTLTLDAGATVYQSVTVDYTPPGSGAKTADAAGNAAGALTGQAVRVAGDPSFVLEATNPFGLNGLFPQAKPVFVDIDGDGDLDVLVGNIGINLQFYRNVGSATAPSFTLDAATAPFGLSGTTMSTPAFADLDGDGDLDVLVGSNSGSLLFLRNIGTATAPSFTLEATNPFGLSTFIPLASPSIADLDGDGDLDILVGSQGGDTLFYRNVGTATAPSFTLVGTNPFGLGNSGGQASPTMVDIDGDGDLDILVGNIIGDTVVYRNVGTATAPSFTLVGTNPFGLSNAGMMGAPSIVDIDGDGDLDALVGAFTSITLFRNVPPTPASLALTTASNSGSTTDTLTNVTAPAITGLAKAFTTVVLYEGATALGTVTADANGLWTVTTASLGDGAHSLTAVSSDATGTSSASSTLTVTIDSAAPNAPTVTTALSNSATPTLTGTAEADSTVTVTVGGATYTTTATNGTWSLNLATATPASGSLSLNANSTNAVSATATDAAGNVSSAGTQTLTIDTTLPDAPTVTSAALTKNATPILTGTAEADSTVIVTVGGATYTTTATNGSWSVNLATATPTSGSLSLNPNGTNAVSATATDAAGNVSTAGTQTLTIDTTAPNAPTVTTALSNSTTPTLTGTAETGSTVTVTVGGATYTTTATNGSWSLNLATATPTAGSLSLNANGTNTVSATATDAAGNTSSAGTQTLTIDTTLPDAPTVTSAALSNSTTPTLTGTAEANATVTVTVGGATYTTTASGTGAWSVNLATETPASGSLSLNPNGTNTVSATATDAAGNVSTAGTQTLTIDTTAPNAPTVTTALSNSATPTLTGTAEADSTVTVTVGGATYTTTATNGTWSVNLATATPTSGSLSLNPNGSNAVSATATDAAGNTSTAGTQTLTIDTTAPNAPAVTSATLTNSATPTLTGTAEAGSTVTVTVGGATYTTTATNGSWSINLATATPTAGSLSLNANGTNAVSATATDAAGNTSSAGTQTLTIDTTLPDAPTVTSAALSNSTTPTLTGTAETGSTVTVTVGGATYTTTATNGTWSLNLATATPTAGTLSLNPNGTNAVSATATDASGNVSAPGTQTLTIDTTLPDAPTVTTALSNSTTPTLTGTAEANATVTVTVGGATYTTTASGSGAWSLDLATATPTAGSLSLDPNGANPVAATATDAAGNVSSPATHTLTVDTTPPTASVLFDDDSIDAIEQSSTAFTISGGEAGAAFTWTITSAGGGQVSGSGVMSGPTAQVGGLDLSGLGDGTLTLTLALTDPAGNASLPFTATTQKLTATVDKPAPVAPPPVATVDGATVTGAITTGSDGSRTTTVTIEASTGTRVEDTSTANPDLADVPVVREQVVDAQTGQVSTQTTLTVSVSTGVAVTATGAAERQTAAQALTGLTGLIAAIEARTDEGTAARSGLTGGGSGFLSVLSAQAQLLVRAIDFTAPGVAAGQAVQTKVTGTTLGGTGPTSTAPTAVVLNTTGLTGPVTIQLDNVEFAAVVGNATLVGG